MYFGQDFISTVIAVLLFSYTTICKGVPVWNVILLQIELRNALVSSIQHETFNMNRTNKKKS